MTKINIKNGLVSVIMSNYNNQIEYLRMAIDSVLKQSYQKFEFIIVDDCSTDCSIDLIEEYAKKDSRIRVIRNVQNLGITKSLNRALVQCRGEYIARMDGDDICNLYRFEKQIKFLKTHPHIMVCGTWAELIGPGSEVLKSKQTCKVLPDQETFQIQLLFGNHNNIIHPTAMFRHEFLLSNGIKYNEKYLYAQDYRMWVECCLYGACANVPEILFQYRLHEGAISGNRKEKQSLCTRMIVEEQLKWLDIVPTDSEYETHFAFVYETRKFDLKYYEWIKKLLNVNRKKCVFNQKKLSKMLWEKWGEIMWREIRSDKLITEKIFLIRYMVNPGFLYIVQMVCKKLRGKGK